MMTWIPCVVMAGLIMLMAYGVSALVLCVIMRIFRRGINYKAVLQVTADAFAFVPRHLLFSLCVALTIVGLFGVLVWYCIVFVHMLVSGLAGICGVLVISLFLWGMFFGTREKRNSQKRELMTELMTLRQNLKGVRMCGGRGLCRFGAQMFAITTGCGVAWYAYVAFLSPIRMHCAMGTLERRFDERLSMTRYSRYRRASLCRDVMRQVVNDDWRLQLFCGDIPVDWLLDEIGDLDRRILKGGLAERETEFNPYFFEN